MQLKIAKKQVKGIEITLVINESPNLGCDLDFLIDQFGDYTLKLIPMVVGYEVEGRGGLENLLSDAEDFNQLQWETREMYLK